MDTQMALSQRLQPMKPENLFRSDTYFHWCSSMIRDENGYHLFYSRWERKLTFNAWLTHSTIAHAVAQSPEGPFTYVETVLDFSRDTHIPGDLLCAHGPKIQRFGGKYYLYFSSTHVDRPITDPELRDIAAAPEWGSAMWKVLRENQRSYVAVSDSLSGPFVPCREPLLEPSGPIQTLVVNPAAAEGPDGRYYLIVKGDTPGAKTFHRSQAVAVSDHPDRGFRLQPEPVIREWDTEDMDLCYDRETRRFYALFHGHTCIGMMTSRDGITWEKAQDFLVTEKRLAMADGSFLDPVRLERPALFREDGTPRVLSAAVQEQSGDSYIILIPLR